MRRGQVALYLVLALVAIAVLMFMNVNIFLAVRAKNQMMNAVDEAAIAVARLQGSLLNEVGRMNVEHLRAAVLGEKWTDATGADREPALRRMVLFGPVEGVARANETAFAWGFSGGAPKDALNGFRDHISEIRNNPDLYPPGPDNVWGTYADALARAFGGDPAVLPSYMEMVHPGASGLFGNAYFYDVIAGRSWCWFNGRLGLLNQDPTQVEEPELHPVEAPENSEVFSLHVTYGSWMDSGWAEEWRGNGFSAKWTNFVCQVTGLLPEDFSKNSTADDFDQVWAFYDDSWGTWSGRFNPDQLPIAGTLKPEYDITGCFAACMMIGFIPQIEEEDGSDKGRRMLVTAEAKPLGTVEDLDGGGRVPVTAYHRFIAPSHPGERIFTEAHLVLVGTLPRSSGVSMDPEWYEHVKKHAPNHLFPGCRLCKIWAEWADPNFRQSIRDWFNSDLYDCDKPGSDPTGYNYAH